MTARATTRVVPFGLLAIAVVAGLWTFVRSPAGAQISPQAQVEAGHALFVPGCSSCHGADGRGITGRGPSLVDSGAAAADFYLRTGRMPLPTPDRQPVRGHPAYDEAQIQELVAYVGSLGSGPAIPAAQLGDVPSGNGLFQLNCAPCHSAVGAGGALSYGDVVPPLYKATVVDVEEAIRIGPGNMPKWSEQAITPKQAHDIAAYVHYLHHPNDRGGFPLGHFGPIPEGFVGLVLGLGLLVLAVRFIGTRA